MSDKKDPESDIFGFDPLEITWRCLACGHLWHRSEGVPDVCAECSAPKTEFILIEED